MSANNTSYADFKPLKMNTDTSKGKMLTSYRLI